MVGKLHLGAGGGAGLKGRGHFGKRDRTVGPFSAAARRCSAASSSRRAARLRALISRRRPSAPAVSADR